jgi:hypothetical protein
MKNIISSLAPLGLVQVVEATTNHTEIVAQSVNNAVSGNVDTLAQIAVSVLSYVLFTLIDRYKKNRSKKIAQ